MNLRKLMLVPLLPMALTGCNDDIDTVKNARMQVSGQFTIDQAFSHRDVCKSVDWEVITDDRNRKLVQYKCHIADIEPYYENERQRQKNNLVSYLASQQPQIKPLLESARVELESAEKSLNAPVINKTPLESDRLSALLNLSEMLNENPPWKSLRNYFNPPIGQELVALSQRFFQPVPARQIQSATFRCLPAGRAGVAPSHSHCSPSATDGDRGGARSPCWYPASAG